jgi:hypothetical protein
VSFRFSWSLGLVLVLVLVLLCSRLFLILFFFLNVHVYAYLSISTLVPHTTYIHSICPACDDNKSRDNLGLVPRGMIPC